MSYPKWIIIKLRSVKIFLLKTFGSIDYWLDIIVCFHLLKPDKQFCLEFLFAVIASSLNVKHRRQVSLFQLYGTTKELRLRLCRTLCGIEMVCSSHYSALTCLMKIIIEIFVNMVFALSCLDKDKTNRRALQIGIAKHSPINIFLIPRNINTSHLSLGIFHLSMHGTPARKVMTGKSLVDECGTHNGD